jgi:hypothetical protein
MINLFLSIFFFKKVLRHKKNKNIIFKNFVNIYKKKKTPPPKKKKKKKNINKKDKWEI